MPPAENPYNSVRYPGSAFLQTHPDRLAVLGILFGMNPPDVEHCRVLELACGDAANLIPMAFGLPDSEFVGVDLAAKPVAAAQDRVKRAGLKNIRVERMDLLELEPAFGEFDYIIAHGVYAWVPEAVQERILAICSANLSANGLAFISYNTDPAGRIRQILREMMQFHEQRAPESKHRVREGKSALETVLKVADPRSPWRSLIENELKLVFDRDERVVYHDDLGECFSPISFGEFVERASRCRLQYVSDASLGELMEPELSPEAHAALNQLAAGDSVAYQQYLDFAKCRRFRQTLLCHAEIPLRRDGLLERVKRLLVASPMKFSEAKPDGSAEFANIRGAGTITTNNPVVIAALKRLENIWPHAERFEDLANAILPALPETLQRDASDSLVQAVLKLAVSKLSDLRTHHIPAPKGISEHPTASFLARLMAQEGSRVTTMLHTHVEIEDEEGRKFLELLDGTRDRKALADALARDSSNESRESALAQIDSSLLNFYQMGLLVS
jgi:methyltransferase-like protein/protein-L-isoaspartate O-methyltransferase